MTSEQRSALRALAGEQAGVVSREQALAFGVSDRVVARLLREQHWRRLAPGVFLTTDADPGFLTRGWAGVLLGGDRARLAGTSAGHLQGLVDDAPPVVTVLVPHGSRPTQRDGWRLVRERAGSRDARSTGAPPRTRVEETVLDLCQDGRAEDAVGWVTVAVQRRLTTAERLVRALERRERHRHRRVLLDLVRDVGRGAQSPIELTYLREVERAHGLPSGSRQEVSADGTAVRDVWYRELGVVVELDGRVGHDELGRFRDMWRDNTAALSELLTLRYGAYDLYARPCEVAQQVGRALTARGWRGLLRRCGRCRLVA